jgi:hypothetical protein
MGFIWDLFRCVEERGGWRKEGRPGLRVSRRCKDMGFGIHKRMKCCGSAFLFLCVLTILREGLHSMWEENEGEL